MRELPALVTVAAIVVPLASVDCYSVPDVAKPSDGGIASSDGPLRPETSGSSSGSGGGTSSSGGSSGSSSGGGNDAAPPDASCTGLLCPCNNANDCASGVCAQTSTVGGALGHAGFCTKGCCTSADCLSGTVCYAPGEGGQYCVDPTWLGRSKPASNLRGGATCSTGSDCLSGLCVGGACADTCCSFASSSMECETSCVFGTFPGMQGVDTHFAPHCAPLTGNTQTTFPCSQNSDCQGGLCYDFGGAVGSECTQPCRTSSTSPECGSNSVCAWDVQGSDAYAACFPLGTLGSFGASCSNDTQCGSGVCNSTNCTGPCFADGDCTAVTGWRCAPNIVINFTTVGMYPVLSCGP